MSGRVGWFVGTTGSGVRSGRTVFVGVFVEGYAARR